MALDPKPSDVCEMVAPTPTPDRLRLVGRSKRRHFDGATSIDNHTGVINDLPLGCDK
jgi:hypothetical protein